MVDKLSQWAAEQYLECKVRRSTAFASHDELAWQYLDGKCVAFAEMMSKMQQEQGGGDSPERSALNEF